MSSTIATTSQSAGSTPVDKDIKLLLAIIKAASITKINFDLVATELGLEKASAARMRWTRFKAAQNLGDVLGKEKGDGDEAASPAKRKAGKAKEKATKNQGKQNGAGDEVKEEEIDSKAVKKAEM